MIEIVARASHQLNAATALATGFARHGIACSIVQNSRDARADTVVTWGWRTGQRIAASGRRVLVMERAYVADRFHWISLGWDGLNGRARFPAMNDGGDRWRQHFGGLIRDPRSGGDFAVVMGQVPGDMSLQGRNLAGWYERAARVLRRRMDMPVVFRPHPQDRAAQGAIRAGRAYGMPVFLGDLNLALARASAVAAFNSNSLTDAALAGVPVLAEDHGAMAWPVAGRGLDSVPALADRTAWTSALAWTQWTPQQIASGEAWEALATCRDPGSGRMFGAWRDGDESGYDGGEKGPAT